MKAPAFSAPPLAGEENRKASFRELLFGQKRGERFFEAGDAAGRVCLLWMEGSRFGMLRAYPCLLWEEGGAPLRFDASLTLDAEENNRRLLQRWEELTGPERLAALQIRPLEEAAFRARLKSWSDAAENA